MLTGQDGTGKERGVFRQNRNARNERKREGPSTYAPGLPPSPKRYGGRDGGQAGGNRKYFATKERKEHKEKARILTANHAKYANREAAETT
jgi:hypothetical protein